MEIRNKYLFALYITSQFLLFSCNPSYKKLSKSVTLAQNQINGAIINTKGKDLVIYGNPVDQSQTPDVLLITHIRRDLIWAAESFIKSGSKTYTSVNNASILEHANSFWKDFIISRYHDYEQQTSKYPIKSIGNVNVIKGGDIIDWENIKIQVINTPGYTRDALSYVFKIDGRKMAFVGDLIYGDGKLFDIYSLQDGVEDLNIMGYHGYAS